MKIISLYRTCRATFSRLSFLFPLPSLLFTLFLSVSLLHGKVLLVDDFNDANLTNNLDKNNGAWKNYPNDKTASCEASFNHEKKGYSLKLDYDVDSSISYFHVLPTYILDYSANAIIGPATQKIPHLAFNGFYFLLGGIDLSEYKYLVFYVHGDEEKGYTRKFQIELKTANQSCKYIVDGVTSNWKKFVIPLGVFEKIDNWKCITELVIVFNENVIERTGTLYFDNVCFTTSTDEKIKVSEVAESDESILPKQDAQKPVAQQLCLTTNLGLNYRYTPERKNEIFHSAGVTIEGKTGKITGRVKINTNSQEFGESAGQKFGDEYPYSGQWWQNPTISLPTVQLGVEQLSPLFNKITVGNIWVGYSPYIVSPYWGWKGVSVSGRKGDFEQATFLIKRPYNSFSIGNRSLYYIRNHRLQIIGVYDSETAKLISSSQEDASLSETGGWTIKPVSSESSYLISTLSRFANYRVNLELIHGHNYNKNVAQADYSDPGNPLYSISLSSPATDSDLYEYRLFFDGLPFNGAKLTYSYRNVGTNYKPRYRQEPGVFEEVIADQKGNKVQFEQWYKGFSVNMLLDDIVMVSNSNYFRKTFNYGMYYLGPKGMELKVNQEKKKEKNEELERTTIYWQYNFIYPDTPGLVLPLVSKFTYQKDRIFHPDAIGNKHYVTESFEASLDYRLMTDCGFLVSYKTTKFGDPSWASHGSPFGDDHLGYDGLPYTQWDNYFKVFVNLNF